MTKILPSPIRPVRAAAVIASTVSAARSDDTATSIRILGTHLLARTIRVESDLVDQLFNSSEKRLARALLLLANFGKEGRPEPIIANISQATLAEMIGTTRPRVTHFMNKFRQLGFIEYNGALKVHSSLLSVVLHDQPQIKRPGWRASRARTSIGAMRRSTHPRPITEPARRLHGCPSFSRWRMSPPSCQRSRRRPRQKTRIDGIFDIERRASLSSAQGGTRRETFSGLI
jgi:hypothetical protein